MPSKRTGFEIERRPFHDLTSQELVAEYQAEVQTRIPQLELDQAAPPDPYDFDPPTGSFLVMLVAGEPAGCGALRRVSDYVG